MKTLPIVLTAFLCLPAAVPGQTANQAAPKAAVKAAAAKPKAAAKPAAAAAKRKPAMKKSTAARKSAVPAKAAAGEPPVVTVGDRKIGKDEFENYLKSLPPQVQARFQTPDTKRQFAQDLSELFALAQEAERRGVASRPQLKAQLDIQRSQLLANTLMQELMSAAPVDDAAMQQYFQENKSQYEQVAGRHILIRFKGSAVPVREGKTELSEEEALAKTNEIRAKIASGADFAEVAKAESDDVGSGANGGSLGTFGHGQMVPEFEKAAFALPVGEISEPVKSQFGYHLIQIQEQKHQTFEEAKGAIEQRMRPDRAKVLAEEIKKTAGIRIDDVFFGPKAEGGQ